MKTYRNLCARDQRKTLNMTNKNFQNALQSRTECMCILRFIVLEVKKMQCAYFFQI